MTLTSTARRESDALFAAVDKNGDGQVPRHNSFTIGINTVMKY
jgi:hypothetical protein